MADETPSSPTPLAEISHAPSKAEEFLEKNVKVLIGLSILIAAATAGYIILSGLKQSKAEEAGAMLFNAEDIASLRDVMDTYADSPSAGSAAVLLADSQWKDGRRSDSITTLRDFLASYPDHPARGTALLTLGTRLLEEGQVDEARTQLQAAADDPESAHVAPFALVILGDLEKKAGNTEAAEALYQRAGEDFPDNSLAVRSLANSRLALLGVAPPTKVEPEPEPEPAPDEPGSGVLAPPVDPMIELDSPAADAGETPPAETWSTTEDGATAPPADETASAPEDAESADPAEGTDASAEGTEASPADDEAPPAGE